MKNNASVVMGIWTLFPLLFMLGCAPGGTGKNDSEGARHAKDTVAISMMKFNPDELRVSKGDTVVWLNNGLVPHTVKSYQDNKFYSDTLNPGQAWSWVVTDSASYFCTIHPATMKATILLRE